MKFNLTDCTRLLDAAFQYPATVSLAAPWPLAGGPFGKELRPLSHFQHDDNLDDAGRVLLPQKADFRVLGFSFSFANSAEIVIV
jgi:hypothetical protein